MSKAGRRPRRGPRREALNADNVEQAKVRRATAKVVDGLKD
jgi:hypothetical protein